MDSSHKLSKGFFATLIAAFDLLVGVVELIVFLIQNATALLEFFRSAGPTELSRFAGQILGGTLSEMAVTPGVRKAIGNSKSKLKHVTRAGEFLKKFDHVIPDNVSSALRKIGTQTHRKDTSRLYDGVFKNKTEGEVQAITERITGDLGGITTTVNGEVVADTPIVTEVVEWTASTKERFNVPGYLEARKTRKGLSAREYGITRGIDDSVATKSWSQSVKDRLRHTIWGDANPRWDAPVKLNK